jgi:FdhD protein
MQSSTVTNISIRRITNTVSTYTDDQLAIEEPLEIQLAYGAGANYSKKAISVTMRTPGNDEELAAGFLFTEGIIKCNAEVEHIVQPALECNRILVSIQADVVPLLQKAERNFYTTSSCGVCGKTSIVAIKTLSAYQKTDDAICVDAALFCRLPNLLRKQQLFLKVQAVYTLLPSSIWRAISLCSVKMLAAIMHSTK